MPEEASSREIPGPLQTIGVLVFNEDKSKVLMVEHKATSGNPEGIFGLPAGRIQLGESPRDAAIRELKEETGLEIGDDDLESFEGGDFAEDILRGDGSLRRAQWKVYHAIAARGQLMESVETIPQWVELKTIEEWAGSDAKKDSSVGKNIMPNVRDAINNYLSTLNKRNE